MTATPTPTPTAEEKKRNLRKTINQRILRLRLCSGEELEKIAEILCAHDHES